jgi:26S proteasome regulatory subunit N1
VRHLAEEIVQEYKNLGEDDDSSIKDNLIFLAKKIVPSLRKHHAETEACDLLLEVEQLDVLSEVEQLDVLEQYVDEVSFLPPCKISIA